MYYILGALLEVKEVDGATPTLKTLLVYSSSLGNKP